MTGFKEDVKLPGWRVEARGSGERREKKRWDVQENSTYRIKKD